MSIKNNIQSLQEILNKVNALPEAGTDLPALDNEGLASDLLTGKQLIDDEGNVVTGTMSNNGAINKTMDGINTKSITISKGYTTGGTVSLDNTIDNEVNTQENLMSQIKTVLSGKAAGGGGSGDNDVLDALLDGSITEIESDTLSLIRAYAFAQCSKLTTALFPACTVIGSNAFSCCTGLTSISFPVCTSIGEYAFYICHDLTTASFPECTTIDWRAFHHCSRLTSISFPKCMTIGSQAFDYCGSLIAASFPACTHIGSNAFFRCKNLTKLTLAKMSTRVCTLTNSNALTETPIASGTGYIYVPYALVSSYKSATNWAYFSNQISAIAGSEDWEMPGTGGDATLITFAIGDVSYQAEYGMTWEDWVNSDYNIDAYYIIDDLYVCQAGTNDSVVANGNGYAEASALIIANESYMIDPY